MTTRWRWSPRRKCAPAACPTLSAVSAVIGGLLVSPRMPSVPKNLRVMTALLARWVSRSSARSRPGIGMQPGRDEEQQGPADQGERCPGDLRPRANGKNAVCAVHSCQRSPISLRLLAVLADRADRARGTGSRRRTPSPWAWRRRSDGRSPTSAKPHIIGWRVIANTPRGAPPLGLRAPGKRRIADERADEQDRAEPHQQAGERATKRRRRPTTAARGRWRGRNRSSPRR